MVSNKRASGPNSPIPAPSRVSSPPPKALSPSKSCVTVTKPASKFCEFERVLCYEPDHRKVRVIYDAKILQVAEELDSRKRLLGYQYKVHFQGWNASWDRYVSEDFLLKDTPENREHQKELAIKAEETRLFLKKLKKKRRQKPPSQSTDEPQPGPSPEVVENLLPESIVSPTKKKKKKKEEEEVVSASNFSAIQPDPNVAKLVIVNGSSLSSASTSPSNATATVSTTSSLASSPNSSLLSSSIPPLVISRSSPRKTDQPTIATPAEAAVPASQRRKRNTSVESGGKSASRKRAKINLNGEIPVPVKLAVEKSTPLATPLTRKREPTGGCPTINLSDNLKRHLDNDHDLIIKKRKLSLLPAEPNIVTVLEDFVRQYAAGRLVAFEKFQRKSLYTYKRDADDMTYERTVDTIEMCKEVAEGLRILIDFNLQRSLLYLSEREQFDVVLNSKVSPQIPGKDIARDFTPVVNGDRKQVVNSIESQKPSSRTNPKKFESAETNDALTSTRRQILSRRTSCETAFHSIQSSTSNKDSVGSTNSRSTNRTSLLMPPTSASPSTPQAVKLMRTLQTWKLVPHDLYLQTPPMPSLIYGPIYLLRLFVKLPQILMLMDMPAKTCKLIVKFIDAVLNYFEGRPDLFSQNNYDLASKFFGSLT